MLVNYKLHNLRNLVINLGDDKLFALVDCEEFKMIRRPHIIIKIISSFLEMRKRMTDVFNAFPDVLFTIETHERPSSEEINNDHKKYQNVVFKYLEKNELILDAFFQNQE
jgi:hypothetical protein